MSQGISLHTTNTLLLVTLILSESNDSISLIMINIIINRTFYLILDEFGSHIYLNTFQLLVLLNLFFSVFIRVFIHVFLLSLFVFFRYTFSVFLSIFHCFLLVFTKQNPMLVFACSIFLFFFFLFLIFLVNLCIGHEPLSTTFLCFLNNMAYPFLCFFFILLLFSSSHLIFL